MAPLNVYAARCEALFASGYQPSDRLGPEQVRDAILEIIRAYGVRACRARVAQEYGDQPECAVRRMRWVRETVAKAYPKAVKTSSASSIEAARPLPPVRAA